MNRKIKLKTSEEIVRECQIQSLSRVFSPKPATPAHTTKVEDLTIGQLMFMANDGLVNDNLLDDLYYHLLDSKKVRKHLKNTKRKSVLHKTVYVPAEIYDELIKICNERRVRASSSFKIEFTKLALENLINQYKYERDLPHNRRDH